jgi:hypothetical protein
VILKIPKCLLDLGFQFCDVSEVSINHLKAFCGREQTITRQLWNIL